MTLRRQTLVAASVLGLALAATGMGHGAYCVGCGTALMLALFSRSA